MPNQELIDYIKNEQQRGLDESTITASLLNAGWQQVQIDEAFGFILPQQPLPQPASFTSAENIYNKESPVSFPTNNHKKILTVGLIFITILIFMGISASYSMTLPSKTQQFYT